MMMVRWRLLIPIVLLAVMPALAQTEGANNARGFQPGKVYDFFGLDSVDPFSGNLNLRIPLQSYEIRPGFGISFFIAHNGKLWDYWYPDEVARVGIPENYSNCGFGWLFTLGRVLKPQYELNASWMYLAPDGGHHAFPLPGGNGILLTEDGTYMRMKLTPPNATPQTVTSIEVDTPDGLVHTFGADGMLTEIRDLYGNWVRVSYAANGDWEIREGYGPIGQESVSRTHHVTFEDAPPGYYPPSSGTPNFQKRIKTIELAAFPAVADAKAIYTLHYDDHLIQNGACGSPSYPPGYGEPSQYTVPLLIKIDLPDGSSYEPQYNTTNVNACDSGTIKQLRLPTKGFMRWTYGTYSLPREECHGDLTAFTGFWTDNHTGVSARVLEDVDESARQVTRYTPSLASAPPGTTTCDNGRYINIPLPPKVFINRQSFMSSTIPNVAYHYTDNYFSAMRSPLFAGPDAVAEEYGLALTRTETMDATTPLSTKTYDSAGTLVRTTYRNFEVDPTGEPAVNPRVNHDRTLFNDDNDCEDSPNHHVPCWVDQTSSDFDGNGHYRSRTTTSNFPETGGSGPTSGTRTEYTNFVASNEPYLLNTYTNASVAEKGVTRETFTTFEPGKGTIRSVRTGSGPGALLSATCRDGRGFITSQRWFGGDTGSVPSDPCNASRGNGEYILTYTNTFDGAKLVGRTARWDGTNHKVLDETLDANTGLASSTRDSAGLTTTYDFDTSGRIHILTPPGVASTIYTYNPASISTGGVFTRANVLANTNFSIQKLYQYDALGRLFREKTLMPDFTWSFRETEFDDRGNKLSVSSNETLVVPPSLTEYDVHPQYKTLYTNYDIFDRPRTITAPDNTTTTYEYFGSRKTVRHFAVNGLTLNQAVTETNDAFGRLHSVSESSDSIITKYQYDLADHLTSVTMTGDSQSQTRAFCYDTSPTGTGAPCVLIGGASPPPPRGFLLYEQHPELGALGNFFARYHQYDARGHVRRKVTGCGPAAASDCGPSTISAGAVDVRLTYDTAERLTSMSDQGGGRLLKEYLFGDATPGAPANTYGKLWKAIRHNYIPGVAGDTKVTETYGYDASNGMVGTKDTIVEATGLASQTFSQAYGYNSLGEATGLTYPTCPSCSPNGGLGTLGRSFTAGRLTAEYPYATLITYHPSGMVHEVTHAGNLIDVYADDRSMGRPARIDFKGCPTPVIVPAQTSMCVGSTNSASVTPVPGASYFWTIENGSITSSNSGPAISFTSTAVGTVVLHVSVSVVGCSTANPSANITVTSSATITAGQPMDPNPIAPSGQATLSVSATGSNLTYQWYQGNAPDVSHPLTGATGSSFTTPQLSATTNYWVRVGSSCGSADSRTATVTVLAAPGTVQATTEVTTTRVLITWSAVTNAGSYVVQFAPRIDATFQDVGPPTAGLSAEHDLGANAPLAAYVYRVVSRDGAGRPSPANSPVDFAVTGAGIFSDEPISKNVTLIRAAHIVELRNAIDKLRIAANKPQIWQGAAPPSGLISPVPITTLFAGLNEARTVFLMPAFTYSAGIPMPQSNGAIRSEHIQEVRNALR